MRHSLHVHRSASVEALVEALGRVVSEPLSSPFVAETVIVPSRVLGRWLALRLAELHGIWANPRFVTAEAFLDALHESVIAGAPPAADDPFAGDALTWSIAADLPALLSRKTFASVAGYLEDDHDSTKRIALARKLGRTFHGYLLLRPALLESWERSAEDPKDETAAWEAELWRCLVEKHGANHRARRHAALIAALTSATSTASPKGAPERISVFLPEALPGIVLDALHALARHADVHLFARHSEPAEHPLTDSMGRRERSLHSTLEARAGIVVHDEACTVGTAANPSVLVHSCHAPMRECEVLRDQLLAALDEDPSLEARDILVLCPDLETYAPVIDAVFGIDDRLPKFVPYRVVDRSARKELAVVDAFLALLDLAPSRANATDIVDLLALEPVRTKFALDENEIDVVREWVRSSGIRWGEDADHRNAAGQPRFHENTWRFGLDRLLIGYAMGNDDNTLCDGCLPYGDIEGSSAATLGGLASYCEQLFTVRKMFVGLAPFPAWRDRLADALPRLVSATWQTEFQHQMIRDALDDLVAHAAAAGFTAEVPLSVVHEALAADLEERSAAMEHAPGGITFASFTSARCVPARVVAMLGMNDGDFPRLRHADAFDLVSRDPKPGDPSRRDEDRQAFLDALLCARDRVIVTYIGQSIATNAERPPSVVISELLDVTDGGKANVVRHPLHAFSPQYFGDGKDNRLFSHAETLCSGARSMRSADAAIPPFVERPLPPADRTAGVTLDALVRFFEHPIRAFMQTRVGVSLGRDVTPLEDREPLDFDALQKWAAGTALLERARDGEDVAIMPKDVVAQGILPLGVVGRHAYRKIAPEVVAVAAAVAALLAGEAPPPREVTLDVAGTRITGWLRNVGPHGQVQYRFGDLHGRMRMGAWVRHLALSCMKIDLPTTLIGKNKDGVVQRRYQRVHDAEKILAGLVDLYWLGMEGPLLFLPDPAVAYVEALPDTAKARADATKSYSGEFGLRDNCRYIARVLGDRDPIDPAFELFVDANADPSSRFPSFAAVAERLFVPLLEHEEVS